MQLQLHYTNHTTPQLQLHYTTATTTAALHHTTSSSCGWGDRPGAQCNHCSHSKEHNSNHLLVHQWICSAIRDSQRPTSPIGFLFLKLLPPPCAVLLVAMSWLRPLSCHGCGPCFAVVLQFSCRGSGSCYPHSARPVRARFWQFSDPAPVVGRDVAVSRALGLWTRSPVVFCNCTSANYIRVVAFSALLAACNWRGGGCDDVDECCCVAHSFSQLFRLASGNSHGGGCVNQCCSVWEPCI